MTKFEVGKTYSCRSICDHDCIYSFTIHARTDKTVTTLVHAKPVRRKVRIDAYENCEVIDPLGRYSMSPVLRATKVA